MSRINYDSIEKWSKRNPLLIFVMIALVMISSLMIVMDFSLRAKDLFNKSLGAKQIKYKKIGQLSIGVDIGYFIELLGNPAIKGWQGKNTEHLFIDEDFFVQAIADENQQVFLFSVTTRRKDFNPIFTMDRNSINPDQIVRLGKTRFCDVKSVPKHIYSNFGNRCFEYREDYYFGNLGYYFDYHLCHNLTGALATEFDTIPPNGFDQDVNSVKELSDFEQFRSQAVINTFGVSSYNPEKDSDSDFPFEIGVDYQRIRMIPR